MRRNDDVRFISFPSIKLPRPPPPPRFDLPSLFAKNSLGQLIDSIKSRWPLKRPRSTELPFLCSASLSLTRSSDSTEPKSNRDRSWLVGKSPLLCSASLSLTRSDESTRSGSEERVLISEVLIRNKDGEELERKDLETEALGALKACRANSALTVREVQEDVHRIIDSGYFCQCMPVAIDTRDGIRLIFQVVALYIVVEIDFNLHYIVEIAFEQVESENNGFVNQALVIVFIVHISSCIVHIHSCRD